MCSPDEVGFCDDDKDKHPDDWHCRCKSRDDDASDDSSDSGWEMKAEKWGCEYDIFFSFS